MREVINMNNAVNRQLDSANQNSIGMIKVDLVFEGAAQEPPQHL